MHFAISLWGFYKRENVRKITVFGIKSYNVESLQKIRGDS